MKFGAVPVKEALSATAVHTIRQDGLVLKKGTPIGPAEVAALEAAGITEVVVARLEPGDVSEDVAAAEIAKAVAGEGVHVDRAFTGRANLFAHTAGILVVDKDAIDRLNRVDEAITLATLPAYKPLVAGEMIATVKIIPFAILSIIERCCMREREFKGWAQFISVFICVHLWSTASLLRRFACCQLQRRSGTIHLAHPFERE